MSATKGNLEEVIECQSRIEIKRGKRNKNTSFKKGIIVP